MLQLIRTITRVQIDRKKPPYVSVAVLGSHSDHENDAANSLRACQQFIEDESFDGSTDIGGLVNELRRFGMTTSIPSCGPGNEQSDPNIVYQKNYSGNDSNGWYWIVSYSVVRV